MEKSYKDKILSLNPYLLFLPLLFLYIIIVLLFSKDILKGDEGRYIWFAQNLIQGYYSPPAPDINLWNGPGYPIILIPFVSLKLPFILIKLLNTIFLYLSAIFFFKTLQLYNINKTKIIIYSYIMFGLYYLPFHYLSLILTEIFTIFLISAFTYMFCYIFKKKNVTYGNIIITSILLAYLALTKVIFGYVVLACLTFFILMYLIKKSVTIKRIIMVYLLALLFCTPYLVYTYSITNKIFYWGNSGGSSLYWMSTPYENEFGNWHHSSLEGISEMGKLNHKDFFYSISNLSSIEKDNALKKEAIKNIKEYPNKYFMNWIANVGRLLFSYPFSYANQTLNIYITILPNMFIVVFSILFLYPTIKLLKIIPSEIILLLVFVMIYLFGSSLLSAYRRQFIIIIPIIGLWFGYLFNNFIRIDFSIRNKL
jgi:hypothetical protein